ncbi:MAG: glycerol-3-phosphate 1-O-acyltransferase PlsY [Clostridia bacterium]|nr:glycerol-3-phosphate 1-O-acyltransferase PlsY [Clostridia bacterium]
MMIFGSGILPVLKNALGLESTGAAWQIMQIAAFLLCAIVPYLLGSINSSVLVSHLLYRDDVRRHGSRNAGLTNMYRVYGAKGALLTLLGDMLKAVLSVYFGGFLIGLGFLGGFSLGYGGYIAAVACVIGHIWPIFYGFKGGKGVLCSAVAVGLLCPSALLVLVLVFVGLFLLTRYVSLSSCAAAGLFPIFLPRLLQTALVAEIDGVELVGVPLHITAFTFAIAFLVIWCHRANIVRLWNGKESKFFFRRSSRIAPRSEDGGEEKK